MRAEILGERWAVYSAPVDVAQISKQRHGADSPFSVSAERSHSHAARSSR
jgi:hypothetical protein